MGPNMKIYQQFLTASQMVDPSNQMVDPSNMIRQIIKEIKLNKSTRKDGTLLYEILPTEYVLPKSYNEEKEKTKWEKFAEEKGIKKKKKSRMVFSEKLNKWLPRYGSRSEQNQILQGGVVEVEQSMSKMINEKRARVAKNKKNAEANRKRK